MKVLRCDANEGVPACQSKRGIPGDEHDEGRGTADCLG